MSNHPTRSSSAHLARFAAGIVAAVVLLSGCTTSGWLRQAPPAAGVGVTAGQLDLRNLVIVTNDKGEGVLMGAGYSQVDDALLAMTVVPVDASGKPGQPQSLAPALALKARTLTQTNIKIVDANLKPGLTSQLTLGFQNAGTVNITVPSLASTHPDFKDAYAAAMAKP